MFTRIYFINRSHLIGLAVALALLAGVSQTCVAASDPMTELLDMMTQKGMLTDQEAGKVKAAAEELKAQQQTNDYNAMMAASASKWNIGNAIKNVELFGDVRFRYEDREARTPTDGKLVDKRLRYALRLGLRGELVDQFYYGVRLDTAANPRSPWVTFGSSTSGAPYQGPFGKSTAGINLSLIYLGWRPASWVDVTIGAMPNPLYVTPMLWDTDINPTGLAERFKYAVGQADLFANFGQFIYQDVNPVHTASFLFPNVPEENGSIPFLLAWQMGVNYHIDKDMSFKVAPTLYNYTSHGVDSPPAGSPATPGFSDNFVGAGAAFPVGASGFNTGVNDGFTFNQTGINDLLILDVPFEFNFKVARLNARAFGDFADNLAGAKRAEAAVASALTNNPGLVIPLQKNDVKAYQIGFSLSNGEAPGLVYGARSKKGNWEARAYWQHVEQYALDPNLLDSDFFEGRGNLEGIYSAFAYSFTDGIIGTLRYGHASRINKSLGTGGSNQDLPQVNPIKDYQIMQFDLTWRL